MPWPARRARTERGAATDRKGSARFATSREGIGKLTRPTVGDYGRARGSASTPSGFAPLELGLALPLLARRVTLCLAAGFAPGLRRLGRGRLAPRLCPRLRLGGRRLGTPPGLRLRIPCCPFGLVGPLGTVRPLGTVATLQ